MIYLYNNLTSQVVGIFGEHSQVDDYYTSHLIVDKSSYIELVEVSEMSYISRICYVDGSIIYNNKNFWTNVAPGIYSDFSNHVVLDWMENQITELEFKNEFKANYRRISNIITRADEVAYNIKVGGEFIALFREECISVDIGSQSGMSIATSLASVIPLIQTGSFQEAATVISNMTRNDYLTDARLSRYKSMLQTADIITYM
jgi:hypothetical protein